MIRSAAMQVLAATILLFGPSWVATANAAEGSGCAAFKWPVEREQAIFLGKDMQDALSGSTVAALPKGGISLSLLNAADVKFTLPPAGRPKDGAVKGAVLNIGTIAKAGAYQVTLSSEAWIDLIQAGKFVGSTDHSGAKDCPGLRKIVRFNLTEGPLVVQISTAAVDSLKLAILPVQ